MNIRRFVITALRRFRQTYDESIPTGLPSGGAAGQALVKKSAADGDVQWAARASVFNESGSDLVTVTDGGSNRISLTPVSGGKARLLVSGENIGDADPDDQDYLVTDVYVDGLVDAVSARVTANETALAARYTKAETDAKLAEAMTDVDNEHFHPVKVLPDPADADPTKRPRENHEYVLIEYEQDGTTIKSETHYLFYDGAYHQKKPIVSLDGYATEQYVDEGLDEKASLSADTATPDYIAAVQQGIHNLSFGLNNDNVTMIMSSPSVYYKEKVLPTKGYVDDEVAKKQATLVSGTNIKTVNNQSLLGSGNINIGGSGGNSYIVTKGVTTQTQLEENMGKELWFIDPDDTVLAPRPIVAASIRKASQHSYLTVQKTTKANEVWKVDHPNTWTLAQSNTFATQDYVDEKAGANFEVGAEKWCGTYKEDGVTYQVYSKIVKIDALPATAGITNYPHGITGIKQILSAYGFTTDGFVLNAPRQNAQDNIAIYQVSKSNTTGSIAIEVGKDRSSKQAYVCLLYAKNN